MEQFNEVYVPIAIVLVGTLLAVQLLRRFVDSLGNPEKSDWYWKDLKYNPYDKKSDEFGYIHEKPKESSGQKRDSKGRFLKNK